LVYSIIALEISLLKRIAGVAAIRPMIPCSLRRGKLCFCLRRKISDIRNHPTSERKIRPDSQNYQADDPVLSQALKALLL
jgi:hypothetical protein